MFPEGGVKLKTRVAVEICGKEFILISDESEDYMQRTAAEINRRVDETMYRNLRTSRTDAAILTALDLCDENFKLAETNDNMRRQILQYIDEISELNKNLVRAEKSRGKPDSDPNPYRPAITRLDGEGYTEE